MPASSGFPPRRTIRPTPRTLASVGRSFLARAHGLSDEEVAAKVGLLMKDLEATIAAELKAIRAFAHVNDLVKVSFFCYWVCVFFFFLYRSIGIPILRKETDALTLLMLRTHARAYTHVFAVLKSIYHAMNDPVR